MLTEFRGSSASTYDNSLGSRYVNEHEISGCAADCEVVHEVYKPRVSHETCFDVQLYWLFVKERASSVKAKSQILTANLPRSGNEHRKTGTIPWLERIWKKQKFCWLTTNQT